MNVLNQAADKVECHGWPGEDRVGYDGANAAFLIAQHSDNDERFQHECVKYIRDAYYEHQIDAASYAYILDRTRINSGKPQLFGTQFETTDEHGGFDLKLKPVENVGKIDIRRRVFGLEPVAKYLDASKKRLLQAESR